MVEKYKFGTIFKFFKNKDFRFYDENYGLWVKIIRKQVIQMISHTALEYSTSPYSSIFNNISFFKNFINWLMIVC